MDKLADALDRVRQSSAKLGKTIDEWNKKFGDNMHTLELEEATELDHENGPWIVQEWPNIKPGMSNRVVLLSEDFCHDASLEIHGDFTDYYQKVQYAHRLAARMNTLPPETKD